MANSSGLVLTEVMISPLRSGNTSRLKAMVTLTFNGVMRVNGCKVIEGSNGLFLSYPSEKRPGSDQYFQHAFVFCRDTQEEIQKQVLDKYRKTMELQ